MCPGGTQVDQDPAGLLTPDGRDRRSALRTLAHEVGNLAARLTFLSANLQGRLTDAADRLETTALLEDSTRRLQEIARKLREMDKDV
mgnify:CR=1 FL=1